MVDLTGKRVLVTGGAVRIGRHIVLGMARHGVRVVLHYNASAVEAHELLEQLGGAAAGHLLVKADLQDVGQRHALINTIVREHGPLDGLVNNASVYRRLPLLEAEEEAMRRDYEVNFVAPFTLMQQFARHCRAGFIINLLDQRVATTDPGAGAYGLAKKSLRDVTEAAAIEWAPAIRVNAVAPGLVLPPPGVAPEKMLPLLANIPMGCPSSPEEVAAACVFLAMAETITGHILYVDGGMHLAPCVQPEQEKSREDSAP